MRYSPVRALFGALQIALLLTVQLAEGTGVHRCPEHDAGVGAGMGDMAAHAGHHGGSHQKDHSSCQCVGVCCQATLVYSPSAPIAAIVAILPVTRPESVPVSSLRDSVRLLPFAIGPPAAA